jgi:hypothetical protein
MATKPRKPRSTTAEDVDTRVTITISGTEYSFDPAEWTLDDLALLESVAGVSFRMLDMESAGGQRALAFLLKRKAGEEVTLEDVGALKPSDFGVPRPTKGPGVE